MEPRMPQKRKHMRVDCKMPIEVIEPIRARLETVNLSIGGAYCSSPVYLASGIRVTCLIRSRTGPKAREDLQVNALIRRSLPDDRASKRRMVALQFVDVPLPAENSLQNILEKMAGIRLGPSRPGPQE